MKDLEPIRHYQFLCLSPKGRIHDVYVDCTDPFYVLSLHFGDDHLSVVSTNIPGVYCLFNNASNDDINRYCERVVSSKSICGDAIFVFSYSTLECCCPLPFLELSQLLFRLRFSLRNFICSDEEVAE